MTRPRGTSDLRPPTGLDQGVRAILLRMLTDTGVTPQALHDAFLRQEHYADINDYLHAVISVWGRDYASSMVKQIAQEDRYAQERRTGIPARGPISGYSAEAFLNWLPEPDFLTCIEIGHGHMRDMGARSRFAENVSRLCERRGVPYRMQGDPISVRFVWTGDATVEEVALQPALTALADPRLAPGAGQEFATARAELREGTPAAFKHSVAEACNAVESALKVLLTERQVSLPARQSLDALLAACKEARLFPPAVDGGGVPVEQIITGPGRFGNRRGRHGGGAVTHAVEREEAEAVLGAAAVAIAFIAKRLP